MQDLAGQDVLDSDAFAEHEGGFAAAAQMLGATPELYHVDTTRGGDASCARSPRRSPACCAAGAINPRWIAGQMRHGHRGAAEIAETLDNLFAYAALTDAAPSRYFDLLFDATCGDDARARFPRRGQSASRGGRWPNASRRRGAAGCGSRGAIRRSKFSTQMRRAAA